MEHIIDWILDKQSVRHKIRQVQFRAKRNADDLVKFCPRCSHAWEHTRLGNGTKSIARYKNLPSYGKKKIVCPKCISYEASHTY